MLCLMYFLGFRLFRSFVIDSLYFPSIFWYLSRSHLSNHQLLKMLLPICLPFLDRCICHRVRLHVFLYELWCFLRFSTRHGLSHLSLPLVFTIDQRHDVKGSLHWCIMHKRYRFHRELHTILRIVSLVYLFRWSWLARLWLSWGAGWGEGYLFDVTVDGSVGIFLD